MKKDKNWCNKELYRIVTKQLPYLTTINLSNYPPEVVFKIGNGRKISCEITPLGGEHFYVADSDYNIKRYKEVPDVHITLLDEVLLRLIDKTVIPIMALFDGRYKEGNKKGVIKPGDYKIIFFCEGDSCSYATIFNNLKKVIKPLYKIENNTILDIDRHDLLNYFSNIFPDKTNQCNNFNKYRE